MCDLAGEETCAELKVKVKYRVSPSDLALATLPGLEFDPQTHQFSDEELKPQAICKKSKKQVGSFRYSVLPAMNDGAQRMGSAPPGVEIAIKSVLSNELILKTNKILYLFSQFPAEWFATERQSRTAKQE